MSKFFEALKRMEEQGGEALAPGLSGADLEREQENQMASLAPTRGSHSSEPMSAASIALKSNPELYEALMPAADVAASTGGDAYEPVRYDTPAVTELQAEVAPHPLARPVASNFAVDEEPIAPETDRSLSTVRVLPLQIPFSAPVLPFDGKLNSGPVSERYRIIRTKILQHPRRPRMIVVSSPGPGDGKSITAVNLAGALSLKANAKVLLLDADFRRGTIHEKTGLPQTPGLAGLLEGRATLEEALIHTRQFPSLFVLPNGARTANPAELLSSTQWHAFCQRVREEFAYIIVDSPPIAAVTDYDLIQDTCEGVILVARPDHTKRQACFKAMEAIPKDKLIGVIVNCVEDWFVTKAVHYDSYYHYQK